MTVGPWQFPRQGLTRSDGAVAERSKAAVLKTAGPVMVPWVRIPPAPPINSRNLLIFLDNIASLDYLSPCNSPI